MVDCDPERFMCLWKTSDWFDYIPVLNVHLITDSLGLHKICILKKTSSKEE